MAKFQYMLLVLFPLNMLSVQSAPNAFIRSGKVVSNILFSDDATEGNLSSSSSLQQNAQENHSENSNQRNNSVRKMLSKLPKLEDMNQNWGILVNGSHPEYEDEKRYRQPIHIPKPTDNPLSSPAPAPEVLQANIGTSRAHSENSVDKKKQESPTRCEVAQVVCCIKETNMDTCFGAHGCFRSFPKDRSSVCRKDEIQAVLEKFAIFYG